MSRASSLERLMLDLVNQERREAGLDPLRLELRLNDSAEDHSDWMLRTDRFSHTGEGGSSAGNRMRDSGFDFEGRWTWGENIAFQSERGAAGLADDVEDLHEALMRSPGHRANILKADFEVIGIGIERGDYKGYDAVMVTQNFARTAAPLQIDGGGGGGTGGGGSTPTTPPTPAPSGGSEPQIAVRDFALSPGQFTGLNRHATYADADGDPARRFEIDGPDGARVKVAGQVVDAEDGHVLAASDFGRLVIQFNRSGEDQTFRIRADDGDGWGAWDAFTISAAGGGGSTSDPRPRPPANGGALAVDADDIVLKVGERAKLSDHVAVTTDGAPARAFKIVAPDGGPDLWMSNRGDIDASGGLWFGAKALGRLYVEAADRPGSETMRILVSDGDERSAYESFTVTTDWDGA